MPASMRTGALADPLAARKDDCYESPPEAVHALLRVESIPARVWEPACGPGSIVRVLRAAGHDVIATDLVDYGLDDSQAGIDFLMEHRAPDGVECVITNPPYKLANAFVRHALNLCPTVMMLMRLAYLEGERRSDVLDRHLSRVWLGRERLPRMHRFGWDGQKNDSSAMPFAWFVFERSPASPGVINLQRMSWRS